MKDNKKYRQFASNRAYITAAKNLLQKVSPDGEVVKPNDLEDMLDLLKHWDTDIFLHLDGIANAE